MRITPIQKQDRLESRSHTGRDSVSSVGRPTDAIGDTPVTWDGDARLIEVAASEVGPDALSRRTALVTALPARSGLQGGGTVERVMQGFDDCFAALQDPRGVNARRHDLWEILMIALCAVLSGGQTAVDMAVFAEAKQEFLGNFLQLKNGVPSHDTFSRVFRQLDPTSSVRVFSGSRRALAKPQPGSSPSMARSCAGPSTPLIADPLCI
jgi:DDE_Tnp_1-associated